MQTLIKRVVMVTTLALVILVPVGKGSLAQAEENVLRVGSNHPFDAEIYDPYRTYMSYHAEFTRILYTRLAGIHKDGSIYGVAATSWALNEDGTELRFQLRDDLLWSDGTPVTAADYVRGIIRACEPEAEVSYDFQFIRNARAYSAGETKEPPAVFANGDHELVVELATPHQADIMVFAKENTLPLAEGVSNPVDGPFNGPFVLESITDNKVTFVRNPQYHDIDQVMMERIEFLHDPNGDSLNDFALGNVDIVIGPLGNQERWAVERFAGQFVDHVGARVYTVDMHKDLGVLADPRVREAMYLVLERDNFGRKMFGEAALGTISLIPPGFHGYQPSEKLTAPLQAPLDERIDIARKLMSDAGYNDRQRMKLRLVFADKVKGYRQIASFLAASWKNIFIDTEIIKREQYVETVDEFAAGGYHMAVNSGNENSTASYLSMFVFIGINDAISNDTTSVEAVKSALNEIDPQARQTAIVQADEVATSSHLVIPVVAKRSVMLVQKNIEIPAETRYDMGTAFARKH